MGDAAGDVAPGGVALSGDQAGDVVEGQHQAVLDPAGADPQAPRLTTAHEVDLVFGVGAATDQGGDGGDLRGDIDQLAAAALNR